MGAPTLDVDQQLMTPAAPTIGEDQHIGGQQIITQGEQGQILVSQAEDGQANNAVQVLKSAYGLALDMYIDA